MGERYAIAPGGVFDTIQGEGAMLGAPTTFVRLAGCSVGCDGCDTDYRVWGRLSVAEIVEQLQRLPRREWVWLTGGEPTDHPLGDLIRGLRACGYRIALATAGVREHCRDGWRVHVGSATGGVDFLSVSPHGPPAGLALAGGDQLNLVPGLGRLRLSDWSGLRLDRFSHRWVTPLRYDRAGTVSGLAECVEFVRRNDGFRLGVQAHAVWGLP